MPSEFQDAAFRAWQTKYSHRPPWGDLQFVQLAKAEKRCDGEGVALAAWMRYLACREPFFEGHEPGKFLLHLSRWVAGVPAVKRAKAAYSNPRLEAMAEVTRTVYREMPLATETERRNEMKRRWGQLSREGKS